MGEISEYDDRNEGGMKILGALNLVTRHAINFLASLTVFILSILNFDFGIWIVPILTISSYYISNKLIFTIQKLKRCKELGMSKSEYNHIESQIKIAKRHINSLTQQYIQVRSIRSFKLLNEMTKLSKRILNIVHSNPKKFFAVEDFFYSHLPSAVTLIETYTLLTQQQLKDTDIHLALEDTRKTLKNLHESMESDLKSALSSDLESLRVEIDYIKHENEKRQQIDFRGDK